MTGINDPNQFSRRILLAVTGLSPQIITETLCALVRKPEPFIPTEIHVITTSEGAERVRQSLLHPRHGWFHRLQKDYGLPDIRFDGDGIHVIHDARGEALTDIRTPEENERTGDQIVEQVRRLTSDSGSSLHASIAGGRKTMGFYLGYALSLYGRPQDRLSHVLVSAPFESRHDFFYPPPAGGKDCAAEVTLAEIPFVRLRQGLDERLVSGEASFSAAVASAQAALDPGRLVIDLEGKRIGAGRAVLHLPPVQLAFLSWLARRKVDGLGSVNCPAEGVPEQEYASRYLREYEEIADPRSTGTEERLKYGMSKDFFEQTKSRLHQTLKKHLGPASVAAYGIEGHGKPKRFEVAVRAENIEWRMID